MKYRVKSFASFTLTFETDLPDSPDDRSKVAQAKAKQIAKDLARKHWPKGLEIKFDHVSPCLDTTQVTKEEPHAD